jgi:enoyl-CoA hydratase
MSDHILVECSDSIARVTLNRADKLNCVTIAMWRELKTLFESFDADEDLRCIVIIGAGGRAFCVGADISEFSEARSNANQARAYAKLAHGALAAIAKCRHPVIAAVRGLCVGGGLELASVCDMRICTDNSRFGIPIKRLGLVVAYAELLPLVRLVGTANAKEILLEGKVFGAARAHQMGLVNRLSPELTFDAEIAEVTAAITEGAPLVARWHKQFVDRVIEPMPLSPEELDESFHCFDTDDFRIGTEAFMSKAKPGFTGPMTPGAIEEVMRGFKKALIERAPGAAMSHHLGYSPGAANPSEATDHHNGKSGEG